MKKLLSILLLLLVFSSCKKSNVEFADAIKSKNIEQITKLADSNIDEDFKTNDGKTLMDLAKETKNYKIKAVVSSAVYRKLREKLIGRWKVDDNFSTHTRAFVNFTFDEKEKVLKEKWDFKFIKPDPYQKMAPLLFGRTRLVYLTENEAISYIRVFQNYRYHYKFDGNTLIQTYYRNNKYQKQYKLKKI